MENRLELVQKQTLSGQMIQSVMVLQMNMIQLQEHISQIAMENPVIELEEQRREADAEKLRKIEWLAELDEQNRFYYSNERRESSRQQFENIGREENAPEEMLLEQLQGCGYSETEMGIFSYIAKCLDGRGYCKISVEELSAKLHTSEEAVRRCLAVMKQLEPAGVCAEDLKECLLLQLQRQPEDTALEETIVREYLEEVGKNRIYAIAKKLQISEEAVWHAVEKIRKLNPKPLDGYADGEAPIYVTPDVTVVKFEDHYEILINDYVYPAIHLNQEYMAMLENQTDGETKAYLKEKFRQAKDLQESIGRRNETLLKVTRCILEVQEAFFRSGKRPLRPLTISEAAEKLEISVSTVSRAANEKYLQCCWGTFPLSVFFSKGVAQGGEHQVSVDEIRGVIRTLIEGEDKKKPYSDQKLEELLREKQIVISRRAIAKYREEMGIPSTRGRKSYV